MKRIPLAASHVKFKNEHDQNIVIDLERHKGVNEVYIKMTCGDAMVLHNNITLIEAAQLRDALMALQGLPKSRSFVFYRRRGM